MKRRIPAMKKKISFILALVMAASMLAGCKKTDEESAGLPEVDSDTSMSSLTQMTMETTEETTTEETTTTLEETTEETTTVSETETSETSSATESETSAAETTEKERTWNETEISETLYIKTSCYSRKEAIVGSESVKKYDVGQKINIVAATDTGYYKLADGTYIHSDYVTDQKPDSEQTAVTTAKTTTESDDYEEIIVDDDKKPSVKPVQSSYNKSYKDRYPYQQLGSSEQKLYADIVNAAESFESEVEIPKGLSADDVFKVYCLVYNQEPQLFWLSNSVPISLGGVMNLEFDLTPDEVAETQKLIDANVNSIIAKVNGYTSTVSKLKVIYDWVVTHNDFSLQGNYETCGIYNGLTNNTELQCQGYAKSVLYLCDVAGIECMVVTGKNEEGSTHAWNVVYCDNGYYILDTTWGDPYGMAYATSDYVRYTFFLANDEMIKNSHLAISTMTRGNGTRVKLYDPPACTKSACYYFKAYNKEYDGVDAAVKGMYAEIDAAIKAGKNVAHIKVTDYDTWETLTSNDYFKLFQKYAKEKSSSVSKLNRMKPLNEDVLVVQYDIVYND